MICVKITASLGIFFLGRQITGHFFPGHSGNIVPFFLPRSFSKRFLDRRPKIM